MKSLLCALGFVLLAALPASAQTTCSVNCVLTAGVPFTAAATHDGLNTTGYRVYIDTVKVGADLPLTALQSGTVTFGPFVAPARGTHTIQLSAFNPDIETKGDLFTFTTVLPAPAKPGPLRLIFTVTLAEDGTIKFQFLGIDPSEPAVPAVPLGVAR